MSRAVARAVACGVVVATLSSAMPARGADATPEQLQFAAQEHDLGYRSYAAKQFDEAGVHFENAFFAAPNPAELRYAIRARRDAGQKGRAATLAAIGERRFPGDAAVSKLADETIAATRSQVFEVKITSAEECNAVVDEKVVAVEKAKGYRFFVDPGHHDVVVGWSDNRSTKIAVEATPGGGKELSLTPPPLPVRPPIGGGGDATVGPPDRKPFGPVVFVVAAGVTAIGAGVTIWSGIDTQSNPGTAAVKADCVGQGTSCPQYQQGVSSQLRTNVLLAATGGCAVVTAVIGVFFTQWSRSRESEPATRASVSITPVLGLGQAGVLGTF